MKTLSRLINGVKVSSGEKSSSEDPMALKKARRERRRARLAYRSKNLSVRHLLVPLHLYEVLRTHHPGLFAGVNTAWRHTTVATKARLSVLIDYIYKRYEDGDGLGHVVAAPYLRGMFVTYSAKRAAAELGAWLASGGVEAVFEAPSFPDKRARCLRLKFHPEVETALADFDRSPYHAPSGWIRLDSSTGRAVKDCSPLKVQRARRRELQRAAKGCQNEVLRRRIEHFLARPRSIRRALKKNGAAALAVVEALPDEESRRADRRTLHALDGMPYFLPSNYPGKESARIGGTYNPGQLSEPVRRALFPDDLELDAAASWLCAAVALGFRPEEPEYREVEGWVDSGGDPWGELVRRLLPRIDLTPEYVATEPGLRRLLRRKLKHFVQMNLCGAMPWERPSAGLYVHRDLPACSVPRIRGFYDAVLEDPIIAELLRRLYGPGGLADKLAARGSAIGANGQQLTMRLVEHEPMWDTLDDKRRVVEGTFHRARRRIAAAFAELEGVGIVAAYDYVRKHGRGKAFARFDSHDGFNLAPLRRDRSNRRLVDGACAAFRRALRKYGCFGLLRVTYDPKQREAA